MQKVYYNKIDLLSRLTETTSRLKQYICCKCWARSGQEEVIPPLNHKPGDPIPSPAPPVCNHVFKPWSLTSWAGVNYLERDCTLCSYGEVKRVTKILRQHPMSTPTAEPENTPPIT